ncbi:hypothetical protein U5801_24350 [Lamprobacter modestohalophilus]|uniref:hypothetical protein n=1 Tax=Lamprobacter modestohalophilus TaxID=1064514 RepID=UPI002ADED581|nr:hypothetical protein [Lamprobacter modestohalophilus]MEA1052914.1 hypothetical protein [Lamprobacter modestohalophilus]
MNTPQTLFATRSATHRRWGSLLSLGGLLLLIQTGLVQGAWPPHPLNDTGIVRCGNAISNDLDCPPDG